MTFLLEIKSKFYPSEIYCSKVRHIVIADYRNWKVWSWGWPPVASRQTKFRENRLFCSKFDADSVV